MEHRTGFKSIMYWPTAFGFFLPFLVMKRLIGIMRFNAKMNWWMQVLLMFFITASAACLSAENRNTQEPTIPRCAYYLTLRLFGRPVPLWWESPSYFLKDFPDILLAARSTYSTSEKYKMGEEMSELDLQDILNYLASDLPYQIDAPGVDLFLIQRFSRPKRQQQPDVYLATGSRWNFPNSLALLDAYDRKHGTEYFLQGMWSFLEKHPHPNLRVESYYFVLLIEQSVASKNPDSIRKLVEQSIQHSWNIVFGHLDKPHQKLDQILESIKSNTKNKPSNGAMKQFVNIILAVLRTLIREDQKNINKHQYAIEHILEKTSKYFTSVNDRAFAQKLLEGLDDSTAVNADQKKQILKALNERTVPSEIQNFIQSSDEVGYINWLIVNLKLNKSLRSIENKEGLALELVNPEDIKPNDLIDFLNTVIPYIKKSGVRFFLITPPSPEFSNFLETNLCFKPFGIARKPPHLRPLFLPTQN